MWYVERQRSKIKILTENNKILENNIVTFQGVIAVQKEGFTKLEKARETDNRVLEDLRVGQVKLTTLYHQQSKQRTALESKNVEVKSYLDTGVPNDMRSLLDSQNSKYHRPDQN